MTRAPSSAQADRAAVQRAGFPAFVELALRHKFGHTYVHGHHIRTIAEHCELLHAGEVLTMLLSCPPGAMKSEICSTMFPAWVWSQDPSHTFMRASYDLGNAAKLATDTRVLCQSKWYADRWGSFVVDRIPGRASGAGEYWTLADGFSLCSSIQGGRFTGRHARTMIVDDPIKGQNTAAADPATLRQAREWFQSVAVTRGKMGAAQRMLVVAQRFHEMDLNGLLLEQLSDDPLFVHVCLPWHYRHARRFVPKVGKGDWRSVEGEELFSNPTQRHAVKRMLAAGPNNPTYLAQYQQDPSKGIGTLFPIETMRGLEGCSRFEDCFTVIVVDPTFTGKERSDFMAVDVWGYDPNSGAMICFYSEAVRRDFAGALEAIKKIRETWNAPHVVIEHTANGPALVNMLEREGVLGVVAVTPKEVGLWGKTNDASKIGRAQAASFYFHAGRVHFDKSAPWFAEKARWLSVFPYGSHDDLVDTAVMGVLWLQHRYASGHLFEVAMQAWAGEDAANAAQAPAGSIKAGLAGFANRAKEAAGVAIPLEEQLDSIEMMPLEFSL